MSTLHTVNKSPFDRNSLATAIAHASAGDAILLFEDAVVGARKGCAAAAQLASAAGYCEIFVLEPDLKARGMKSGDLADGVKTVDYGGFVDLAANHDRTCSWL
ncbi:MAG: sulfurtransferase complex subunit TusB [Beijerinckiaceae bacterium]